MTVLPNHSLHTLAVSSSSKTAEKHNFSSLGLNEHKLFDNTSGNIGITLSTK